MLSLNEFLNEESQYEIAWQHFGKGDRLETKTKSFKTVQHREKFANKISEHPKFHSIYGYRDPEAHTVKEAFGQQPAKREYSDEHMKAYADHITNDYKKMYGGQMPAHNPKFEVSFDHGPKYTRVVTNNGNSRSAHSFLDPKGNIWKAAGWKAPAKNTTRGNITTPDFSRTSWTGAK